MSAVGKKKRGEAGLVNAQNQPYRLNGGGLWPAYMRKILGPALSAKIGRNPAKESD
jgi:hypothetical protein